MLLDRSAILARTQLPSEEVDSPELGGKLRVRVMSAVERDRWEAVHSRGPTENLRARILQATCCDEDGKLLFAIEDIPALNQLPWVAVERVVEAAVKLNRLDNDEVKDLEKN